jgi:DNA mismatch repair protein MutL
VLFEAMRREQTGMHVSQRLLAPELVELSKTQAAVLEGQMELLAGIGFDVEPFGGSAFRVRAIPQLLGALKPEDALLAVVEDFEEDETPLAAEAEARLIARVCKCAAVKAGQMLNPEEQAALIRALELCASPRTCPHGRPTMIHLPMDLLARRFGRK